jgi:Zn-dependent protease
MRRIQLFTVRGVAIHVDPSFAVVALFFLWLLASAFFAPAHAQGVRVWMAAVAVVGLALSIVLIEVAHALAARRAGVRVHGVSLFLLGGIAEMSDEPTTPKDDIVLALAGPAASVALALSFHSAAALVLLLAGTSASAAADVLRYLGWLNALLAAFNLLPAFPLDGGRLLRALVWRKGHSRAFATELAAGFGKAFGVLFIVLGVLSVLFESILLGVWWAAIGVFLRRAARRASAALVAHEALCGERVARFMQPVATRFMQPVAGVRLAPGTSLQCFVNDVVLQRGERARIFPVVDEAGMFRGTVRAADLQRVGRAQLQAWTVERLAAAPNNDTCIAPDAPATDALRAMGASKLDRLFVIAAANGGEQLIGMVSKDDLIAFVAAKLEVDGPITEGSYDDTVLAPAPSSISRPIASTS